MGVLIWTQNTVESKILLFVNKQTFKENLLPSVPSCVVWWTSALKISSIQSIHGSSGRIVYGGVFLSNWAENPYCCIFLQIRFQRLPFCYWLSICVLQLIPGFRKWRRDLRCLWELLQVLHFSGFTGVKIKLLFLGVSLAFRWIP